MDKNSENLLSRGLYTVAEASQILRLKPDKVRRWAFGYSRNGTFYKPLFTADYDEANERVLSFLDLVELFLIKKFVEHDVPTHQVRTAARNASRELGKRHPFATTRFGTVGRTVVFLDDDGLVDAHSLQNEMLDVVREHLRFFDIELDQVRCWWPLGRESSVVIDPKRSFGAPTLHGKVAVDAVLDYLDAGDSKETVAELLGLSVKEVNDAVIWRERTVDAA